MEPLADPAGGAARDLVAAAGAGPGPVAEGNDRSVRKADDRSVRRPAADQVRAVPTYLAPDTHVAQMSLATFSEKAATDVVAWEDCELRDGL